MLTLTRKVSEVIIVNLRPLIEIAVDAAGHNGNCVRNSLEQFLNYDPQIRIELVGLRGTQAKIGVDVAHGIPILREEICDPTR